MLAPRCRPGLLRWTRAACSCMCVCRPASYRGSYRLCVSVFASAQRRPRALVCAAAIVQQRYDKGRVRARLAPCVHRQQLLQRLPVTQVRLGRAARERLVQVRHHRQGLPVRSSRQRCGDVASTGAQGQLQLVERAVRRRGVHNQHARALGSGPRAGCAIAIVQLVITWLTLGGSGSSLTAAGGARAPLWWRRRVLVFLIALASAAAVLG